jgi:hypothetical protein
MSKNIDEILRNMDNKMLSETTKGTFEATYNDMEVLRQLYEEHGDVLCPNPNITYEQWIGYMAMVGIIHIKDAYMAFLR